MRKIYFNILILFPFLVAFFFFAAPSYACTINANPSSFSPNDSKANITITTPDCNFQPSIQYTIFAHPGTQYSADPNVFSVFRANPSGQTITGNLNFSDSARGENNPGIWTLEVCAKTILSDCKNQNNIVGTTLITVNAVPTPTPTQIPANLPEIDPLIQPKCSFQIGESVTLTVTKIQPNTNYSWWWESDGLFTTHKSIGKSDASGSNLIVTIPNNETSKAEIRSLCADIEGLTRAGQNCIPLTFTTNSPTGDTSCHDTTSGTDQIALSQNDSPIPRPPCSQWGRWDGSKYVEISDGELDRYVDSKGKLISDDKTTITCLRVNTAVGLINTQPQELVKSVFNVVLGLAGGIALILIIVSGYRFMTSGGNPEKTKAATEQLTSAVIGLLFIIFSFVILQIVGVDILRIPGFTK